MEYVKKVDLSREKGERLFSQQTGSETCRISLARIEPGHSSPSGLHTHEVDQICYIVKGKLNFEIGRGVYQPGDEIETDVYEATENTMVAVPAGVPHRNWNPTDEPEYHLDFLVPEPPPDRPGSFTIRP